MWVWFGSCTQTSRTVVRRSSTWANQAAAYHAKFAPSNNFCYGVALCHCQSCYRPTGKKKLVIFQGVQKVYFLKFDQGFWSVISVSPLTCPLWQWSTAARNRIASLVTGTQSSHVKHDIMHCKVAQWNSVKSSYSDKDSSHVELCRVV